MKNGHHRKDDAVKTKIAVKMGYELYTESFLVTSVFMSFCRTRMRVHDCATIDYMRMRSEADTPDVPEKHKRQKRRLKIFLKILHSGAKVMLILRTSNYLNQVVRW